MRHVFETMGTVVSLDVRDLDPVTLGDIEGIFDDADRRFSLYRPDSGLSLINAGSRSLLEADPQMWDAFALATDWRAHTSGAFSPTRPDGLLDLNGVVKAIAMSDAGLVLTASGADDWTLVVGGDMLTSGRDPNGGPWTTGVIDPADRNKLLCAIRLIAHRRAIATSGIAERGDHIWTADATPQFQQVTVVADDIITADVLATAIVAGGESMLRDACDSWPVDVLTVDVNGELRATPGFRASLASPEISAVRWQTSHRSAGSATSGGETIEG